MKKWFKQFNAKCYAINKTNMLALSMVSYTVNATCLWVHHQPKVPEEALKFRKI